MRLGFFPWNGNLWGVFNKQHQIQMRFPLSSITQKLLQIKIKISITVQVIIICSQVIAFMQIVELTNRHTFMFCKSCWYIYGPIWFSVLKGNSDFILHVHKYLHESMFLYPRNIWTQSSWATFHPRTDQTQPSVKFLYCIICGQTLTLPWGYTLTLSDSNMDVLVHTLSAKNLNIPLLICSRSCKLPCEIYALLIPKSRTPWYNFKASFKFPEEGFLSFELNWNWLSCKKKPSITLNYWELLSSANFHDPSSRDRKDSALSQMWLLSFQCDVILVCHSALKAFYCVKFPLDTFWNAVSSLWWISTIVIVYGMEEWWDSS